MGILLLFGSHIGKKPFLPVVSKRALFYVKDIFRQTDNVLHYWWNNNIGIFIDTEEAGHQPRISLAKLSQNDTRN